MKGVCVTHKNFCWNIFANSGKLVKFMKLKTHENFALDGISFVECAYPHAIPIYSHKLEDNNSESLIAHACCSQS